MTSQSQRSLSALRNSCLIMVEFISRRRSTVTHADDPFSAVRSSTSLIFGGPLTLILSALSLSSSALSELIMFYADLTRDSSGSQCVEDAIWSTRGLVTLTEEASSRLASQLGTVMHRNLATGLGALGCLYFADYTCLPSSQEQESEISHSAVALVDPGCRAVFLETKSTHSPRWITTAFFTKLSLPMFLAEGEVAQHASAACLSGRSMPSASTNTSSHFLLVWLCDNKSLFVV